MLSQLVSKKYVAVHSIVSNQSGHVPVRLCTRRVELNNPRTILGGHALDIKLWQLSAVSGTRHLLALSSLSCTAIETAACHVATDMYLDSFEFGRRGLEPVQRFVGRAKFTPFTVNLYAFDASVRAVTR
jgi:hypothetical protein